MQGSHAIGAVTVHEQINSCLERRKISSICYRNLLALLVCFQRF